MQRPNHCRAVLPIQRHYLPAAGGGRAAVVEHAVLQLWQAAGGKLKLLGQCVVRSPTGTPCRRLAVLMAAMAATVGTVVNAF